MEPAEDSGNRVLCLSRCGLSGSRGNCGYSGRYHPLSVASNIVDVAGGRFCHDRGKQKRPGGELP